MARKKDAEKHKEKIALALLNKYIQKHGPIIPSHSELLALAKKIDVSPEEIVEFTMGISKEVLIKDFRNRAKALNKK